jgi:hypothetical protein
VFLIVARTDVSPCLLGGVTSVSGSRDRCGSHAWTIVTTGMRTNVSLF